MTGVVVTGGNVADGDAAPAAVEDRQANTALPQGWMGDTSDGGTSVRGAVVEVAPQMELTGPVPPASNRVGQVFLYWARLSVALCGRM